MNILLWAQNFWPENFPINNLAEELAKKTCITVLTGKPNYPNGKVYLGYSISGIQKEELGNVNIVRIPIIPRKGSSAFRLFLNYLSFIISGYILAPFLFRPKKHDVIFVYATSPLLQALPAIFLARLRKIPIVVWVQDLWPDSLSSTGYIKNPMILWFVSLFVRYIYRAADLIFIPSRGFQENIEKYTSSKKKIILLENVTKDFMNKTYSPSKSLTLNIKKSFSVVFTGNIGKAQSCNLVLGAAKILKNSYKNIQFFLIGGGCEYEELRNYTSQNQLDNVFFVGPLPPEEMPDIYAASSVLLVTLKDDPALLKTIPSKLQHYLCAGRPIICCAKGETATLIRNAKAGVVCSSICADSLAESIVELYNMPHEALSIFGRNGRKYFEQQASISIQADNLISYLKELEFFKIGCLRNLSKD